MRDDDGFTIVELLMVIAILAVLAGIAIFGVANVKGDAEAACTTANTRIDSTVDAAPASGPYTNGADC